MSKEKTEGKPLKDFNILENSSFGGGIDVEFSEEGFQTNLEPAKLKIEEEDSTEELDTSSTKEPDIISKKVDKLEEPTEIINAVKPVEVKEEKEESSLKVFASWLGEKGIVDYDEETFEDTEDGVENLVIGSISKGIQEYKNSLPEDFHKLVEFVEAGGNAKNFIDLYYNNNSWEDFEINDEKSQREVVEEFLKGQAADNTGNISKEDLEDINETLDTYEVSGIMEKKAKIALNKLQVGEKNYKSQIVEAQKKYDIEQRAVAKKQVEDLKDTLFKKEDIQGFKLTPKLKENLWDFIIKPDKTGKTGLQKHNETNQDAQFMYAYLAMNDWNLEKLERQVKTKINSELASKLGNFKDSRSKMKSGQTDNFAGEKKTGFSAFKQALDNGAI